LLWYPNEKELLVLAALEKEIERKQTKDVATGNFEKFIC
jgi:hypothetical protein